MPCLPADPSAGVVIEENKRESRENTPVGGKNRPGDEHQGGLHHCSSPPTINAKVCIKLYVNKMSVPHCKMHAHCTVT